jgi:hypothetical protein
MLIPNFFSYYCWEGSGLVAGASSRFGD